MKERIIPFGDSGLIVRFNRKGTPHVEDIRGILFILSRKRIEGILDFIPSTSSLTISFDPLTISFHDLKSIVEKVLKEKENIKLPPPKLFKVPVVYGGRFGPDLSYVARFNKITEEEVIKLHTQRTYRVYMIGFIPGFAYLGYVAEKIKSKRLRTPRVYVPKGSVGIGGSFTGIYPLSSPGGWRIIGMTYFNPFNPRKIPPVEFDLMDIVKFERIGEEEFLSKYRGRVEFVGGEDG